MGLSPLCEPEGMEGRGTLLSPVLYIWGSTKGVIQRAESTAQDTNDIVPPPHCCHWRPRGKSNTLRSQLFSPQRDAGAGI